VGIDHEDGLVGLARKLRLADDLFPQERDLLEVRDLAGGIFRASRGMRVECNARLYVCIRRLARRRGEKACERIEDLGALG
jgi:hypothetical protein